MLFLKKSWAWLKNHWYFPLLLILLIITYFSGRARVNKVLKGISLIENLSNRNNYDYTSEEADKMIREIETAVRNMKARFQGSGSSRQRFKF